MVSTMRLLVLCTFVFATGCETEYGQSLRCTTNADCTDDRVCEPIQRYCVLPDGNQGTDAAPSAPDTGTTSDAASGIDGPLAQSDAEALPLDGTPPPPDATQPLDAGPTADDASTGPAECGNGIVEAGEACDIARRGQSDICSPECEYKVAPFMDRRWPGEFVIPEGKRNRGNANRQCEDWGGALVSLGDLDKLVWIIGALEDRADDQGNSEAWIGLTRRGEQWVWGDESSADGLVWCADDPQSNHRCASLKWRQDPPCFSSKGSCDGNGASLYYVCERSP